MGFHKASNRYENGVAYGSRRFLALVALTQVRSG